jgi:hypothetical protein
MDEATGTIAHDFSGNNKTGTLQNIPTWVTGRSGGALNFNGINQRISFPDVVSGTSNFSLFAWVNTAVTGTRKGILVVGNTTGGQGAMIFVNASNQVECDVSAIVGPNSTVTVTDGKWHLVGVTKTGTTFQIYVDGIASGSTSSINPNITSGTNFIGYDFGSTFFNGKIDEARVYNRALSASEVAALYTGTATQINAPAPVLTAAGSSLSSGLVGHWTFDGINTNWRSNTVTDSSGLGNIGTMISMSTTSSPRAGRMGQGLNFDGTNSYVQIPNASSLDLTGAVTMSAWVKAPNGLTADFESIIQKSNSNNQGYQVGYDTAVSKTIRCDLFNGVSYSNVINGTNTVDGKWHHIVCTYNGSVGIVYVDGVAGTPTSLSGYVVPSGLPVTIGFDRCCGPTRKFNGIIDDPRIYNRALSAAEVKQLYLLGK